MRKIFICHMKSKLIKSSIVITSFVIVFIIALYSKDILNILESNKEHDLLTVFFLVSVVFVLSAIISHISRISQFPSFVIAIFFGIIAKPLLTPITLHQESLSIIVGLGATLILFSGGLETPFHNFKKIILKIFSLSFLGLFITAFLTSTAIYLISGLLNFNISIISSVLLGAVLASTDPAAIIPVLKKLRFYNRSVKDVVISESAVTDVTGTLVTIVFLTLIAGGVYFDNITDWYKSIFNEQSGIILAKQIFFGILLGLIGYILLKGLHTLRKRKDYEHEADLPFFLFVPIIIFVFAIIFEGSGYLAAFIAGLLFHMTDHLKKTEHFFNSLVEGFFKPTIFILLGALVNIDKLIEYAPIGVAVAIVFMFVIRPIAVFVSLFPIKNIGKEKINLKEMIFISFVRETGAIPAVLLVTIMSLGLGETNGLLEIGMWVILSTLIILPPLTPYIAKKLSVATEIKEKNFPTNSSVVLVTRGHGFIKRMETVSEWAIRHHIHKVTLLLCLEEKYTEDLENKIENVANEEFNKLNELHKKEGKPIIDFKFVSKKGLLKDNINYIKDQVEQSASIIFAGKKMLDYHVDEIRKLSTPIRFID
jgi:NhaP-type Na+/H+ or K+/H+ antiporter